NSAPRIPRMHVATIPPGSSPGIRAFAMAPTMSPTITSTAMPTIHSMMHLLAEKTSRTRFALSSPQRAVRRPSNPRAVRGLGSPRPTGHRARRAGGIPLGPSRPSSVLSLSFPAPLVPGAARRKVLDHIPCRGADGASAPQFSARYGSRPGRGVRDEGLHLLALLRREDLAHGLQLLLSERLSLDALGGVLLGEGRVRRLDLVALILGQIQPVRRGLEPLRDGLLEPLRDRLLELCQGLRIGWVHRDIDHDHAVLEELAHLLALLRGEGVADRLQLGLQQLAPVVGQRLELRLEGLIR